MKILLTNDDGYQSEGFVLLADKLVEMGHELYVVAPDSQRSAFSHSANIYKDLTFKQLDNFCGAKVAYISSGTPADCVKFAATVLDVKFDLVVSGPNNGENFGDAILYSGTVAAAEEGALWGYKAIALSRVGYKVAYYSTVEYFCNNVQLLADCCPKCGVVNVNVPNLPLDQIKGVKVVPQCESRLYNDYFVKKDGVEDTWFATGDRIAVEHTDSDVGMSDLGYVTITPLTTVRTDFAAMEHMKKRLEK